MTAFKKLFPLHVIYYSLPLSLKKAFLKTLIFPHFQKISGKDLYVRTFINDLTSYIRGHAINNSKGGTQSTSCRMASVTSSNDLP